jgi:hypothetical protein
MPRPTIWYVSFMALFADPDGNLFYLDQLREE